VAGRDDRRREIRREQHLRRLDSRDARCAECGETYPAALSVRGPEWLCAECLAVRQGRTPVEGHHVFGRRNHNKATMPLRANWHRGMTDEQRDWSRDERRNEQGCPLLRLSAGARARVDLHNVLQDNLGWEPEFYADLRAALVRVHGEDFLHVLGLGKYAP